MAEPWIPGGDNFMLGSEIFCSNTFLVGFFSFSFLLKNEVKFSGKLRTSKYFLINSRCAEQGSRDRGRRGGRGGTSWSVPPSKTFFRKSGFRPTIRTATPNIQTPAATPGPQSQSNTENYVDSWFMSEMWLIRMKRCVTAGLRICLKLHLLKLLVLKQYLTKKGHRPWF